MQSDFECRDRSSHRTFYDGFNEVEKVKWKWNEKLELKIKLIPDFPVLPSAAVAALTLAFYTQTDIDSRHGTYAPAFMGSRDSS